MPSGVRARLIWIDPDGAAQQVGVIPEEELAAGETRVAALDRSGPPPGRYRLLRENLGAAVAPNEPYPAFLHEDYEASEKSWVQHFDDLRDEVRVADQVKLRVQEAVECEMETGAVPIGPTFTRGLPSPRGPMIHGMCVVARPRR